MTDDVVGLYCRLVLNPKGKRALLCWLGFLLLTNLTPQADAFGRKTLAERPALESKTTVAPVVKGADRLDAKPQILTLETRKVIRKPSWESWESQAGGQATRMLVLEMPGLLPDEVPSLKAALERDLTAVRHANPEIIRILFLQPEADALRMILEVANAQNRLLKPVITHAVGEYVRIYLYEAPNPYALGESAIPSKSEKVTTQALAEPPIILSGALSPQEAAVPTVPSTHTVALILSPAPNFSNHHVTPQLLSTPQLAPLQSSAAKVASEILKPMQQTTADKVLNETLANVRKNLQAKETALATLRQQLAKAQQENIQLRAQKLKVQNTVRLHGQQVAQLKLQIAQANKKAWTAEQRVKTLAAQKAKPVPVTAAPAKTVAAKCAPQDSTSLFLELQKAVNAREAQAEQFQQMQAQLANLEKALEKANSELQARLQPVEATTETAALKKVPVVSLSAKQTMNETALQTAPVLEHNIVQTALPVPPALQSVPAKNVAENETLRPMELLAAQDSPSVAIPEPELETLLSVDSAPSQLPAPSITDAYEFVMHDTQQLPPERRAAMEMEIQQFPDHWPVYVTLAEDYLKQPNLASAERVLKSLLLLDPQHVRGLTLLTQVYAEQGRQDKAKDTLKVLLSQFVDNADIPTEVHALEARLIQMQHAAAPSSLK